MEVLFGSRISPFTGPEEAKRGRLTIYQECIPLLEDLPLDTPVSCQLFGPDEMLEHLRESLRLSHDDDSLDKCLLFEGDTAAVFEALLQALAPDVPDFINTDDDAVFARLTAEET